MVRSWNAVPNGTGIPRQQRQGNYRGGSKPRQAAQQRVARQFHVERRNPVRGISGCPNDHFKRLRGLTCVSTLPRLAHAGIGAAAMSLLAFREKQNEPFVNAT